MHLWRFVQNFHVIVLVAGVAIASFLNCIYVFPFLDIYAQVI